MTATSPAASRQPAFVRVADRIMEDCGESPVPGTPLPGERELAQRHKVSRGTIIAALDLLAKRRLVERLPARGTFIADGAVEERSVRRFLLPYPEPGISPEFLHPELLGISSELFRGLLDEALSCGQAIAFQHLTEPRDEVQLARQIRSLAGYDGFVFIGHRQLGRLRERLSAAGKTCVLIAPECEQGRHPGQRLVTYGLEAAASELMRHARERGVGGVAMMIPPGEPSPEDAQKLAVFREAARMHGIDCAPERIHRVAQGAVSAVAETILGRIGPMVAERHLLLALRTDYIDALYLLSAQRQLDLRSLRFAGLGSGATFRNLSPAPTYIRVEYHQIGRQAMRRLIASAAREDVGEGTVVPNRLVIGETT